MFLACCCCVLRKWASSLSSISGKRSLKESFNSKVSLAEEPEDRAVTKPGWDDVLVTERMRGFGEIEESRCLRPVHPSLGSVC